MPYIECPACQKDIHSSLTTCPYCNTALTEDASSSVLQYYDYSGNSSRQTRFTGYHPVSGQMAADHEASKDSSDRSEGLSGLVMPQLSETSDSPLIHSVSDDLLLHAREDFEKQPETAELTDSAPYHSADTYTTSAAQDEMRSNEPAFPPRQTTARVKKIPRPGRKLWGYRSGNPILMLLSVSYYMAAAVLLLKGIQMIPEYRAAGTLTYHQGRLISGGLMLYLPAILLSETPYRRFIPIFNSRRRMTAMIGFIILYIPLTAILLLSWYCCL